MKNIIICILFLSVLSSDSSAQKFEIGVSTGVSFSNKISYNKNDPASVHGWGRLNAPVVSIKGLRSMRLWQYGVSVDYLPYSVPYRGLPQMSYYPEQPVVIGRSYCVPFRVFFDRKFTISHFESYAGLSLGYVFWKNFEADDLTNTFTYTAGSHAGTTYYVTRRLGINAEAAVDYISQSRPFAYNFDLISIPVTLGIRYKM